MSKFEYLKNLSETHIQELENLLESLNDTEPTIVCTGLLNAGKSTLLNALIGDIDNKTFSRSDIRETTQNKVFTIDKLTYIDTPGLDANDADTKVVYETIDRADIVLFVHNINTGELDPTEINFLVKLQKNWNVSKESLQNIIFVLSRKDEIDIGKEESIIREVKEKINTQILEIFKEEPIVVSVSSESYQDALRQNELLLLKDSNLSKLKDYIDKHAKERLISIYKNKEYKVEKKFKDIIDILKKERERLFDEKQQIIKGAEEAIKSFKQDIGKLNDVLKQKEKIYKGL